MSRSHLPTPVPGLDCALFLATAAHRSSSRARTRQRIRARRTMMCAPSTHGGVRHVERRSRPTAAARRGGRLLRTKLPGAHGIAGSYVRTVRFRALRSAGAGTVAAKMLQEIR
ncbi:hypothetical protein [Nocardia sp. NPDC050175]|uniref:hypothetical protein n=1 Tax=Nocardia sp. NPDC050175 TaxID=3364317 RepID=UPI0037B53AD8